MRTTSVSFWLCALLALLSGVAASVNPISKTTIPIPNHFVNTKLLRVIDLRTGIAVEDIGIRAKNIDSAPVSEYYFVLPRDVEEHAASLTAFLRQEPKTALDIKQAGFDSEKELQLYKVTFDEPLQPNQEIRFGIKVSYTHVLEPFPAKAPQISRQFLRYHGNVYHFSPYFSQEMKTTLQLVSNNVVSFTGGDNVKQNNNKITYGPFHDIGPESYQPLECHYEYPRPLLTVTELERDLQLSHWANVLQVEENYKLHHAGAELENHFSRLQHQLSRMVHGQTSVLKDLTFKLPPNTRDIYYRDDIGNVSTSRVHHQQDSTVLVITPRYPLFGGWNYTWFHGYNTDLDRFDRYSKQTGQYILNVKLVENAYDMAIDKVETRIILPEGVTNVQVHAPFELDSVEHKTHFTNFDSTGRHMVVLRKYNVVRDHEQPILITYEYSTLRLLQKPLAASAGVFTLFLLSTIFSKLTWTIGTQPKSDLKKE